MFRREFLKSAMIGSAAAVRPGQVGPGDASFRNSLVQENDKVLASLLLNQERTLGHPWIGGLVDIHGIHVARGTAQFIGRAAAALCSRGSVFCRSQSLVESVKLAVQYLLRAQHPDGTIDLHTTNFHSPPAAAFALESLAAAVSLLRQTPPEVEGFPVEELETFMRRAGDALIVGGIHTPNHRWVVCAALAQLNSLFRDERYVARIDEWLAEGIDIDADGQYSERSTSIYSATCDRMLITVARLLNRPELLEPVRRNLEMTRFLVHPNGEVVTEISRRQDQYKPGSLRRYYLPYRYMALRENNGDFAAMAVLIEEKTGVGLSSDLIHLLENKEFLTTPPSSLALPDTYIRYFPASGLVRYRKKGTSVSVVSNNSTFLSMHQGNAVLQGLRLASAFFGKGQFRGRLAFEGTRCELIQNLRAPYYQPLPKGAIPYGTWPEGNRALREQSEIQELTSSVSVNWDDGRLDCRIEVAGTERVPVSVELSFRKGGTLVGVEPIEGIPDSYCFNGELGEYRSGSDSIRFGVGRSEHRWTQLRGAEPKLEGLSVYLSGFTPFEQTIQIVGTSR